VRLRSYPIDRAALVQGAEALKAVVTQASDHGQAQEGKV
jgi:isoquinoline 1-oxidoreductase beta subunit